MAAKTLDTNDQTQLDLLEGILPIWTISKMFFMGLEAILSLIEHYKLTQLLNSPTLTWKRLVFMEYKDWLISHSGSIT